MAMLSNKLLILLGSILALVLAFAVQKQPELSPELPAKEASAAGRPLAGVKVAVTGATSGIGRGLTHYLHGLGATIVAIGRSPSKLHGLLRELEGNHDSGGQIETVLADLTDLASVAAAADNIIARFESVDYLLNNAGIHYTNDILLSPSKEHMTPQGYDVAFSVNYLSHFLLTEKLLPLLENSTLSSPRIIQISSSFHWLSDGKDCVSYESNPPRAALGDASSFLHRVRSYPNSKLAQIMHARALSRQFARGGSKVRAISICPGWVGTNVTGPESFNSKFVQTVAFANDGFGLASTLGAMFQADAGNDTKHDYYVNSALFDMLGSSIESMGLIGKDWPSQTGIRDIVTWTFAMILLWTQKLGNGPLRSMSSPESYNTTAQDNLYQWSKKAVAEWL